MIKTVLITGTSSGYGKAITEHFLAQRWNVIATMRRPELAAFAGDTSRLRVLPLDVTDEASIAALFETAGPIDVLVNNAGIGEQAAATLDQDVELFDRLLRVHLRELFDEVRQPDTQMGRERARIDVHTFLP